MADSRAGCPRWRIAPVLAWANPVKAGSADPCRCQAGDLRALTDDGTLQRTLDQISNGVIKPPLPPGTPPTPGGATAEATSVRISRGFTGCRRSPADRDRDAAGFCDASRMSAASPTSGSHRSPRRAAVKKCSQSAPDAASVRGSHPGVADVTEGLCRLASPC